MQLYTKTKYLDIFSNQVLYYGANIFKKPYNNCSSTKQHLKQPQCCLSLTNGNGSKQGEDEEQASGPHDVWGWPGSKYGGTSCWAQTVLWWAVFLTAQCSWHHTGLQINREDVFTWMPLLNTVPYLRVLGIYKLSQQTVFVLLHFLAPYAIVFSNH